MYNTQNMAAVAMMLVEMERSYVTAGFFRHTMYHRSNKIKQQLALAAAQQQQQQVGGWVGGRAGEGRYLGGVGSSSSSSRWVDGWAGGRAR